MSAIPIQTMHATHARNIRNAFNRHRDTNTKTRRHHEDATTAAMSKLRRSRSSAARLDGLHGGATSADVDHHTNAKHPAAASFAHRSGVAYNSAPQSRRSVTPLREASLRPTNSWTLLAAVPSSYSCSGVLFGQRLVELAAQSVGALKHN